jgi:hypothetical protein
VQVLQPSAREYDILSPALYLLLLKRFLDSMNRMYFNETLVRKLFVDYFDMFDPYTDAWNSARRALPVRYKHCSFILTGKRPGKGTILITCCIA